MDFFPITLFVVDNEGMEESYARTAFADEPDDAVILATCPPVPTRFWARFAHRAYPILPILLIGLLTTRPLIAAAWAKPSR